MSEQVPQGTNNTTENNAYAYPVGQGPAGPAGPATAVEPERPKDVKSSFTLQMFALGLTVVNIPIQLFMLNSDDNKASIEAEYAAEGLVADVGAIIFAASIFVVVVALICIAINLVTAIFTRKGYGWARIVLTVYAALTLVSMFTGTSIMGWWGAAALIIATIPLYRNKTASTYFMQMRQYRQNKKLAQGF